MLKFATRDFVTSFFSIRENFHVCIVWAEYGWIKLNAWNTKYYKPHTASIVVSGVSIAARTYPYTKYMWYIHEHTEKYYNK